MELQSAGHLDWTPDSVLLCSSSHQCMCQMASVCNFRNPPPPFSTPLCLKKINTVSYSSLPGLPFQCLWLIRSPKEVWRREEEKSGVFLLQAFFPAKFSWTLPSIQYYFLYQADSTQPPSAPRSSNHTHFSYSDCGGYGGPLPLPHEYCPALCHYLSLPTAL